MIGSLRGILIHKEADKIILDVQGVGYEIFIPLKVITQLPEIKREVFLYTEMIVREDDLSMYGFLNREDKEVFKLLREAKGVGVKTAFTLLSFFSYDDIMSHIINEDINALLSVPGIGRKTAERIIFELKDRAKKFSDRPTLPKSSQIETDVELALVSLGYSVKEAREAIKKSKNDLKEDFSLEDIIKVALKNLVKG
ncbi:MAG: Holliday junction branch migration protein RuvA [Proteobacteria bacterium]|nr:Holliday junction branch migration protein RuvA [Pseudomonadota bacterium]